MSRHGNSQMRRKIGRHSNKVQLVVELPDKKIVTIDHDLKSGQKRVDVEKLLREKGYKLLNMFYDDLDDKK